MFVQWRLGVERRLEKEMLVVSFWLENGSSSSSSRNIVMVLVVDRLPHNSNLVVTWKHKMSISSNNSMCTIKRNRSSKCGITNLL